MGKKVDKEVMFGIPNLTVAPQLLPDDQGVLAENFLMDQQIGDLILMGMSNFATYPGAITSHYVYHDGTVFVQMGNSLFKNGELLLSLNTKDKLYYFPTVNPSGTSYLLLMNKGGNYKYVAGSIDGVVPLGVDAPTIAPVDRAGFSSFKPYVKRYGSNGLRFLISGDSVDDNTHDQTLDNFVFGVAGFWDIDRNFSPRTGFVDLDPPITESQVDNMYVIQPGEEFSLDSITTKFRLVANLPNSGHFTTSSSLVSKGTTVPKEKLTIEFLKSGFFRSFVDRVKVVGSVASYEPTDDDFVIQRIVQPTASDVTIGTEFTADVTIDEELDWSEFVAVRIYINDYVNWFYREYTSGTPSGYLRDSMFYDPASFGGTHTGEDYSWIYTYYDADTLTESVASVPPVGPLLRAAPYSGTDFQIDVVASGDAAVDSIKIYRIGNGVTEFSLVDTISNVTQTFIDDVDDGSLGALYVGDSHTPPPSPDIIGAVSCNKRIWGFSGSTEYPSEPGDPDSWNLDGIQIGDDSDILFHGVVGNNIYVFKKKTKVCYIINGGGQPPFFYREIPLKYTPVGTSCAVVSNGLYFLSVDGLIFFDGYNEKNLTENLRNTFVGEPGNVFLVGKWLVSTNPEYYIDLESGLMHMLNLDNPGSLTYAVESDDQIYFSSIDGNIYQIDTEEPTLFFTGRYKTKEFLFDNPGMSKLINEFHVITEIEEGAILYLMVYTDGALKYTRILKDGRNYFRPKKGLKGYKIQFELRARSGKVRIRAPLSVKANLVRNRR